MTPRPHMPLRAVAAALFCLLCGVLFPSCSQIFGSNVVVLDIGHFIGGEGAKSPTAINGKRLAECDFWYRYAYDVKKVIEDAGYDCVVTNRGNTPTSGPMLAYARRARVKHLKHPDDHGARYPSKYFPDRVGSGVISADYAIYRRARCVVFLHHNSSSSRWVKGASNSLVICNRHNGRHLAEAIARRMESDILNVAMPNGGRGCSVISRYVDASRAASWMNACDDAGIPAAVLEVAYLNNRGHAQFLSDDANARRYAQAVGQGIVDYLQTYGDEPRHRRADKNAPDEGSFGYAPESRKLTVPGAKHLIR